MKRKIVFIGGLHRSGTTKLNSIISHSGGVAGIITDEGVNLQKVCKKPKEINGPGRFVFHEEGPLDEHSNLVSPLNRERLLKAWTPFWDADESVWCEKSPPNLIRMRFLQALFPEAYFINIVRHPIAVSLATNKWTQTSGEELLEHWIRAHQIYQRDRILINNELSIGYEYFAKNPEQVIAEIERFLDIKINYDQSFKNKNEKYFNSWLAPNHWEGTKNTYREQLIDKYEQEINQLGYSLIDLKRHPMIEVRRDSESVPLVNIGFADHPMIDHPENAKLVFISGLHCSGLDSFAQIIGQSDDVSGLRFEQETDGKKQDAEVTRESIDTSSEAGVFALKSFARLDQNSKHVTSENKQLLLQEWKAHLDISKPVWLIIASPNLIRTSFLQALFPEAYFITIVRHPIPDTLCTKKISRNSNDEKLLDHWIAAHEFHQRDKVHLRNELFFSYEYLAQDTKSVITRLEQFLEISIDFDGAFENNNKDFFDEWLRPEPWESDYNSYRIKLSKRYENRINKFGYSLSNFEQSPSFYVVKNGIKKV